jgi:hypothetical protein
MTITEEESAKSPEKENDEVTEFDFGYKDFNL